MDTVLCGTGEYEQAQPIGGEARSEASDALMLMRELGQERSRVVLEIAYGEVGRHGERLLRALGHYRGEPPYLTMHEALSGGFQEATLAALANTQAIAVLELALSHLFVADERTGGRVGALAMKLEGAGV